MKTKILGEWHGSKTIPLLASGECTILFREDGTAKAVGCVKVLGETLNVDADNLCWEHCEGNKFTGTYEDYQLEFVLSGTKIQTTVNPYRMKAVDNKRFDINVPIEMKRVR